MLNHEILYFPCPVRSNGISLCDFDFIGSVLSKIYDVADLHINRASIPIFQNLSCTHSNNFSFMRFLFTIGENDSAFGGVVFRQRFDEDVIFQGLECHSNKV